MAVQSEQLLQRAGEVMGVILIVAAIAGFLYGFIVFPAPHAMVITRIVCGILFAVVPAVLSIALICAAALVGLLFRGAIVVGAIGGILYVLTRPTFW